MREKRPLYFLVFALIPLLLFLQAPERLVVLHQIGLTVLTPFLAASRAITRSVQETTDGLRTFFTLYRSHDELARRVEALEGSLIEKDELKSENERLRRLLQFKEETPQKAVPARVIGHDLAPWRKTVVIDKGSVHGIGKRMAVVNAQGLVGRVVETAPFSSRVILLLDPESRVSVLFQESRDSAVAEGDASPWLRATHIDRGSAVKVGDRLVSSGLGQVYPKGVPVGQVEIVGTEKEALELFASVRPFVDFSKLEEVLILASGDNQETS